MRRVTVSVLLLALLLFGTLIVAQTQEQRQGTTYQADTSRTTTSGTSRDDMITDMQQADQRIQELYSDWQQIYQRYHDLLEISDQQRLKQELEEVHQMVNEFNRDASALYENYQDHRQVFMRGQGNTIDRSGTTGNTGMRSGDTTMMRRDTTMMNDTLTGNRGTMPDRDDMDMSDTLGADTSSIETDTL